MVGVEVAVGVEVGKEQHELIFGLKVQAIIMLAFGLEQYLVPLFARTQTSPFAHVPVLHSWAHCKGTGVAVGVGVGVLVGVGVGVLVGVGVRVGVGVNVGVGV